MGASDREVMERLNLKRTQYFVYRARLYRESAQQFNASRPEDLVYQKDLLKERLVRLFRQAEQDITKSANASDTGLIISGGRAALYLAAQNIAINLFKLEHEGLRILNNAGERNGNGYLRRDDRPSETEGKVRILPREYVLSDQGAGEQQRPTSPVTDESQIY
jgi:hypothetical protein